MKRKKPIEFPGSKVYFTEGDPFCQNNYNVGFEEFNIKMKLWLLIADHVILSAEHILQSDITYEWILNNSHDVGNLSAQGALILSLSDQHFNLNALVHGDLEMTDQPSSISQDRGKLKIRASYLSDIFGECITWSPQKESSWFRESTVHDLRDGTSPLRKRMQFIQLEQIKRLADSLESTVFLNREKLHKLALQHCPKRHRMITKYGDIFYYLSGAKFKNAYPLLHPDSVKLCKERIAHGIQESSALDGDLKSHWRNVMDTWGITAEAVRRIPLSEILQLRTDSIGKSVRGTWRSVLEQAQEGKEFSQGISEFLKVQSQLADIFDREILKQHAKYRKIKSIRGAIEIGSWVTSTLASVASLVATMDPLVAIIIGVPGFLAGKPIADAVANRLPGAELVVLASKIQKYVTD